MIKLLLQMMESEALKNLFLKLVNMSISASWIVLVVLILRLVLKKAPKWIPVLLWGIVAVRLICPFSIESALSLIPSTQTIPMNIEMAARPAIDSGINAVNSVVNPIISASFTPHPGASANPLQIWIPLVAVIWCFGMALMVLYTAISYWNLCRKVDTAVRYNGNIYQSENVGSPFVLGILKPRIYLPYSMDIGSISVVHHRDDIAEAEIGYCIGQSWWHKGIMTEALTAVMRFLFTEVGMNRIEAKHDINNPHSGGVMKKCGMKYEGTSRASDRNNQGICDIAQYAILREEWE